MEAVEEANWICGFPFCVLRFVFSVLRFVLLRSVVSSAWSIDRSYLCWPNARLERSEVHAHNHRSTRVSGNFVGVIFWGIRGWNCNGTVMEVGESWWKRECTVPGMWINCSNNVSTGFLWKLCRLSGDCLWWLAKPEDFLVSAAAVVNRRTGTLALKMHRDAWIQNIDIRFG